jgi:DNA-binding transcriptional LysR family regulator
MELRQLRYFVAVADELHFTRAAARLHVAQPALSHQIRQLEEEIGVVLLERTNRRVRLTAAGEVFRIRARLALEQTARAADEARLVDSGETGTLSIGFVSAAVCGALPGLLRNFRQASPGVSIDLRELEPSEQLAAIRDEHLDIGMMHAVLHERELETVTMSRERLIVALPERHPEAGQRRVVLKKLANETIFLPKRHAAAGFHEVVMNACQRAGFVPAKTQTTRLLQTAVCLVAGRLGIALVPESFRDQFSMKGVVYRLLSGPSIETELVAVWRRDNKSPLLRRFQREIMSLSVKAAQSA